MTLSGVRIDAVSWFWRSVCGALLIAAAGCQSVEVPAPQRVEKDFAWRVTLESGGRAPQVELSVMGVQSAPGAGAQSPLTYLAFTCMFDHFEIEAFWGGQGWPPTDSLNEGYDYSQGELRLRINGREVWRERGAGYSRPGMISAGDDLSDPRPLLAVLGEARLLDIEARFDDGTVSLVRLDLSGAEDLTGMHLPQDQAIATFVRRCAQLRTGRLEG